MIWTKYHILLEPSQACAPGGHGVGQEGNRNGVPCSMALQEQEGALGSTLATPTVGFPVMFV